MAEDGIYGVHIKEHDFRLIAGIPVLFYKKIKSQLLVYVANKREGNYFEGMEIKQVNRW